MTLLPGCADGIVQQAETYHHVQILPPQDLGGYEMQ